MKALTDEQIARVAHEVLRAYSEAVGSTHSEPWEDMPETERAREVGEVKAHIALETVSAAKAHELWCVQQHKEGWVWGLKKNDEKKKHPNLVPFDQLSFEQRVKSYMFCAVVRTLHHMKYLQT